MAVNSRLVELLSTNERQAVKDFLTRLRKRHPDRVYQTILFGSKARGDSHTESDIDILLVADSDDWRFRHAISDIASDVSLEHGVLIGPRVIGQAHWEEMAQDRFSLHENVAREGIPLTLEAA
jgi:predicted nucleotidyltransferase